MRVGGLVFEHEKELAKLPPLPFHSLRFALIQLLVQVEFAARPSLVAGLFAGQTKAVMRFAAFWIGSDRPLVVTDGVGRRTQRKFQIAQLKVRHIKFRIDGRGFLEKRARMFERFGILRTSILLPEREGVVVVG